MFLCISSDFCSVHQDGILFGMVGAYDWDGGVLKEGTSGRIMPPREAFESEFPLELKNHAAYLGTITSLSMVVKESYWWFMFFIRVGEKLQHDRLTVELGSYLQVA